MKTKLFLIAAIFSLGVSAFANDAPKNANEIKVNVKGMVCAFCAQGIEKKFKGMNEIEGIQVSLENKFVKLKFKDGQKLSNEKITQLLKEAGYEADFGKAE